MSEETAETAESPAEVTETTNDSSKGSGSKKPPRGRHAADSGRSVGLNR